jgi:putative membrane protein
MVTANSNIIPGFYVNDLQTAFEAALVIGILNATLGAFAKVITFPFAILSFGVFLVVINAAMILLAAKIVTGFIVYGWVPAFWAAVVLGVLGILIKLIMREG